MSRPRFDPTVNLGHILILVAWLAGGAMVYSNVDTRLISVEKQLDRLANILVTDSRQDERLLQLERWRERLERPLGP